MGDGGDAILRDRKALKKNARLETETEKPNLDLVVRLDNHSQPLMAAITERYPSILVA